MEEKYGFKKKIRITKNKELRKVLKEGNKYSGTYLNIYYLPEDIQKFSIRLQNHIKGGYRRNKLRRRLRDIVRNSSYELKNGLYIIFGKKLAVDEGYNRLKEDFEKITSKGKLWLK